MAVSDSSQVTAQTMYGEAVYVIGSVPALREWSTDAAVALSADQYTDSDPLWQGSINPAIGQDVQYKTCSTSSPKLGTMVLSPGKAILTGSSQYRAIAMLRLRRVERSSSRSNVYRVHSLQHSSSCT